MPSNYQKIREDNIRRRGEEFDDIGRLISEQLYADRSHFVYELLQNAEDALERRSDKNLATTNAHSVRFLLYNDRLEFRHFGQPFDEDDVRAISDVLRGTKGEDKSQIGKFGIGFKSVYAFTASPRIHSGCEDFLIERFIRPRAVNRISGIDEDETVFVFPFDHRQLSPENAHKLIGDKLRRLGSTVLLFLHHIDEIEYCIEETGEEGHYLREVVSREGVQLVNLIGYDDGEDQDESWLLFTHSAAPEEGEHDGKIQLAFKVELEDEESCERIAKIERSPLVAYFPTDLDTRLGYLIQGPYRTTPSRDNILRNDEDNKRIVILTAELTVQALHSLKKMGLLSVGLLETMPIAANRFPPDSVFYPIYARVKQALIESELLPSSDGTFVSARQAKLARGSDLRRLLYSVQLTELFDSPRELKWLVDQITGDRSLELRDYLVSELGIDLITPDAFARRLSRDFLTKQSDTWMVQFYQFLVGQKALLQPSGGWEQAGPLRSKEIVRLSNDSHVSLFDSRNNPNAYLSIAGICTTSLPIIKPAVLTDDLRKFFSDLGIPEVDFVAEVIESVLPKYNSSQKEISLNEHLEDMQKIKAAMSVDSLERRQRLISRLNETRIVLSDNAQDGRSSYRSPGSTHFENPELRLYFDGNPEAWFVSSAYDEHLKSALKCLSIRDSAAAYGTDPGFDGHVKISDYHSWHERGLHGFDPGHRVEGLEFALANPSIAKSVYIWNQIASRWSECIRGVVERSTRQSYENSSKEERISHGFGKLLMEASWLPTAEGSFSRPAEMRLEDLPEDFERDQDLAQKLGMLKRQWAALAEEAGIPVDDIELIKQNPDAFQEWKSSIMATRSRPVFPSKTSADSDRRSERLSAQHGNAPNKTYEQRDRSVRTTRGTIDPRLWLTHLYTNDNDQMVCQICKNEMPFKKRNGEYYFETVEVLSPEILPKEHEAQFLALCPLCAAMYNEFVKNDEQAMLSLSRAILESNEPETVLQFGDVATSLRFVEIHFQDLKVILMIK